MRYILTIAILFIITFISMGQADPEGLRILDKFSSTALSAPSVSIKFRLITDDAANSKKDTASGSLVLSKDQYRLELPGNIIWFNGSVSWNYLINEKEVTITKPDRKDESFMSRPASIFTLYKKGYKIRLLDETTTSWTVDLYPEDTGNELIRIRLTIGKTSYNLLNAEYKRKDGITITLKVTDYNLKTVPDASYFTFNPKNYRDVEIIDMR
ncbi:MAG TPA: outer membrane lipoprotein carrier protein LolA [Bacteroidales bacterium]|nr:outer membrane lipoprotein carrier protein LolA [Bacteroidales bacterium]HRR93703.1 outer membrane lipoprotein carrier protein LolA [Bacteroidales bacterium]HRT89686.1 outer membrane lipoprotein carrier protein LolA [Bacteroidales bacterium]